VLGSHAGLEFKAGLETSLNFEMLENSSTFFENEKALNNLQILLEPIKHSMEVD